VQDLFKILQSFGVTEDNPAKSLTVYPTTFVANLLLTKPLCNGSDRLLIVSEEVMHDFVSRDGLGTKIAEKLHESTLARRQRAGDGYRHRLSVAPFL
jgi:hypothetical protein